MARTAIQAESTGCGPDLRRPKQAQWTLNRDSLPVFGLVQGYCGALSAHSGNPKPHPFGLFIPSSLQAKEPSTTGAIWQASLYTVSGSQSTQWDPTVEVPCESPGHLGAPGALWGQVHSATQDSCLPTNSPNRSPRLCSLPTYPLRHYSPTPSFVWCLLPISDRSALLKIKDNLLEKFELLTNTEPLAVSRAAHHIYKICHRTCRVESPLHPPSFGLTPTIIITVARRRALQSSTAPLSSLTLNLFEIQTHHFDLTSTWTEQRRQYIA